VGWLTVFGWQVGLASVSYAAALQIQSLVLLVSPGVTILGWHMALMTIAIALIAVGFNTILISKLPTFEFIVLVARKSYLAIINTTLQKLTMIDVAAYLAFAVVLLFMGPQSSRAEVFDNWQNENEWPTLSVAVLVGT
jgi:choline transport protein